MEIKIYADGADFDGIVSAANNRGIVGFTTNPTLMRKAGVTNYTEFAKRAIGYLKQTRPDTCLSLEVFADDHENMLRQARIIDSWGEEARYPVFVKIPITNTKGESSAPLIKTLSEEGVCVNVTAIMTLEQIDEALDNLSLVTPSIVSVFAGRIADAGVDPKQIISLGLFRRNNLDFAPHSAQFLWASTREPYNVIEASTIGCDIITATPDILKKLDLLGKDLTTFSLETVRMFYDDAVKSGFTI